MLDSISYKLGWPSNYPLFVPPNNLGMVNSKDWSRSQSKEYFDWIMMCKSDRVQDFMSYIRIDVQDANSFSTAARIVGELVRSSRQEASVGNMPIGPADLVEKYWEPDDAGAAIGADLGLCAVHAVEKHCPVSIEWITGKGGKRSVHYNLPIIRKLNDKRDHLYFDPIGQGVRRVWNFLRTDRESDLVDLFEVVKRAVT